MFISLPALSDERDFLAQYKLLDRADKLYLYGKYQKAIDIYINLLKNTKNRVMRSRIHLKLGKAYYFLKDFKKSENYLLQVLKDDSFLELTKGARLFLSGIYEAKGNYKSSIDVLIPLGKKRDYYSFIAKRKIEDTISSHPDKNLKKNYGLIDFYITQREYTKALEIINIFLKNKETDSLLYLKAKLLFNKRKYKDSLAIFNRLLQNYKDSKYVNTALYYKATILTYMNRLDEALKIFNSLPLSPSIILKRAYIYEKKGNTNKKIDEYKSLIKKFPLSYQVTYVIFTLAQYYENKKDIDNAIYYYKLLINKYPTSRLVDDVAYRLILIYKKKKEKEGIEKLKKLLISRYPTSIYTYHLNNYTLQFTRDFRLSLDAITDAITEDKKDDEEGFKNIVLLFRKKMYEDAYYEAKALYNKGNRDPELLYILSIASGKIGRYYDSMKFRETLYYFLKNKIGGISPDLVRFVYPKFYAALVEKEAKKYHIDPLLVYAVIREESRFGKYVLSPSYAIGLMQIIPSTGRWIASKLEIEEFDEIMLFNPIINIELGTWYLNYLNKLFSGNIDAILASYNGGPGNGRKWFKDIEGKDRIEIIEGNIGYSESKEYVKKCLSSYYTYKNLELYPQKDKPQ